MSRPSVIVLVACAFALQPVLASAKDGPRDDVRVAGVCGRGAQAALRLKAEDDGIEVRFKVEQTRGGSATWRVALVHEYRVVLKRTVRTTSTSRSFELRRMLADLPGSDIVTAHAWGPSGLTCRATATLAG